MEQHKELTVVFKNEACVLHPGRTIEECHKVDKSLIGICFGHSVELEEQIGRAKPPIWLTVEQQNEVHQERGIRYQDSHSELARLRFVESLYGKKRRNIKGLFTPSSDLASFVKSDEWCPLTKEHRFTGVVCKKCGWGREPRFFNLGHDPFQGPVPPIDWKNEKNFDKRVKRELKRIEGSKDAYGNPIRAFSDDKAYWDLMARTYGHRKHAKPNKYSWVGRDFDPTKVREGNAWRMNIESVQWADKRLDDTNKCDICGKICSNPVHFDRMREKGEWRWLSDKDNERGYSDKEKTVDYINLRREVRQPLDPEIDEAYEGVQFRPFETFDNRDLAGLDLTPNRERQIILKKRNQVVNKLPKQQKRAYHLQKQLGWSVEEVAKEMKISVNTTKMHLRLAVQRLNKELSSNE